jgi:hypothetical protein
MTRAERCSPHDLCSCEALATGVCGSHKKSSVRSRTDAIPRFVLCCLIGPESRVPYRQLQRMMNLKHGKGLSLSSLSQRKTVSAVLRCNHGWSMCDHRVKSYADDGEASLDEIRRKCGSPTRYDKQ